MKKPRKTITEIFREGKALDAAARRAIRRAIRENEALLAKRSRSRKDKRRAA